MLEADAKVNGIYLFDDYGRGVPLILEDKPIIIAIGKKTGKMFYGITPIKKAIDQVLQVEVKVSGIKEIIDLIQDNKIDGINMDIPHDDIKIIEKPCDGINTAISL